MEREAGDDPNDATTGLRPSSAEPLTHHASPTPFDELLTKQQQMTEDLQASEDLFRLLVQSVQDYAIYLLSPDGRVMTWNDGAQRLKGYAAEEVLGEPFARFFTPEDAEQGLPAELLSRAATEGRVLAEGWRIRKDGSRFWADAVLTALRDDQGRLRGYAKVTRDLTERRRAEEAQAQASREEGARLAAEAAQAEIRASRDQLAAILAGVAEGITVQDASGRLVFANEAAARLCGFESATDMLAATTQEILTRFKVFDENGAPYPLERLPGRLVVLGEPTRETLVRFQVVASGEMRWSLVNATPIRDAAGRLQLVVNIFHDITERREAEETAQFLSVVSAELSRSLDDEITLQEVAQLAVPVLADWCVVDLVDEDGQLRRLAVAHKDPAKARLAEEVTRRYPTPPDDRSGVGGVLRTGQPQLVSEVTDEQLVAEAQDPEHLAIMRSLQVRSVIVVPLIARDRTLGAITLVQAESGRRYGARDLLVAQDLAGRAALAIDNERLYREAQQQAETHVTLNTALREAMERLQDTSRTRDDFLASASHDLKNPIASIKGNVQLLQRRLARSEELDPEVIDQALGRIDAVTTRVAVLLDEMLDVARLHLGRPLDLDRQPTDLVALTREIVAEHQHQSDYHQLQFETDITELVGWWDRQRISRVVGNLLSNALKYSPEGGEVRVRVSRDAADAAWALLTVADQGLGIPAADLTRIFERFQRGSNVSGRITGTGIGLASARHSVESHGGTISVASEVGNGSTFTVRLPVDDPSQGPDEESGPG